MKSAGKMKSAAGKSILIGALAAASSASERRRRRESSARLRSVWPSERPSCSPWSSDRTNEVTSGSVEPLRHALERTLAALAHPQLGQHERELVRQGPFRALDQPRDRTEEAEACFDRYRQQIECIGEVVADLRAARRGAAAEQELGDGEGDDSEGGCEQERRAEGLTGVRGEQERREDAGRHEQEPVDDVRLRRDPAGETGRGEPLRQDVGEPVGDQPLAEPLDQPVAGLLRRVAAQLTGGRRPLPDDGDSRVPAPAGGRDGARGDEDRGRERERCKDEQKHRYHRTFPTRRSTNEPQTTMDRATSASRRPLEVCQSGLM